MSSQPPISEMCFMLLIYLLQRWGEVLRGVVGLPTLLVDSNVLGGVVHKGINFQVLVAGLLKEVGHLRNRWDRGLSTLGIHGDLSVLSMMWCQWEPPSAEPWLSDKNGPGNGQSSVCISGSAMGGLHELSEPQFTHLISGHIDTS